MPLSAETTAGMTADLTKLMLARTMPCMRVRNRLTIAQTGLDMLLTYTRLIQPVKAMSRVLARPLNSSMCGLLLLTMRSSILCLTGSSSMKRTWPGSYHRFPYPMMAHASVPPFTKPFCRMLMIACKVTAA